MFALFRWGYLNMTYYDILEISQNASEEVVRMAYKALAKKYHPDVFKGDPKEAEEKMKQINAAFEVLSDEQKRKQYDDSLKNKRNYAKTEGESNTQSPKPPKNSKVKREFKYPSGGKSATIIGILLFVILCQPIGTYAENPQLFDYAILLGIVEFCFYCLVTMTTPILIGILKKDLSPKSIKVVCAVNSVAVFGVSLVLYACEVISAMFIGWIVAVLYYFINKHILLQLKKHPCDKKKSLIAVIIAFVLMTSIFVGGVILSNNLLGNNAALMQSSNSNDTLVVAVEDDFVPFSYKENKEYSGIHIDMAKEMAKRLDCKVKFVSADFDELIDGVDKGRFDIAFGVEKTTDREELVMFTEPYYEEMCAIFSGESFSEYSNITVTLENMLKDGTVRKITSKYKSYLTDSEKSDYYTDIVGKVYDLEGYDKCAIVRTITLDGEFTAEFVYARMEGYDFDEEKIIEIMDEFGSEQGGGEGHLIEPGDYIEEVDEWCFANDRAEGDIAIVENDYGYSICYISAIFK